MSIQFNDTTTYKGLVQLFEKEVGFNRGDVSENDEKLKEFTADCNIAWDDFLSIAFGPDGTWQLDDSNQTDYPFIKTNLVSGQRDYTYTTDGSSNLILDIYRVMIKTSATGNYVDITPVDQNISNIRNNVDTTSFIDGQDSTGTPIKYDKVANGIMLDPVPSYNATSGLKIFINREPSYFAYTDTTKKPGVPGNLHKWFYIKSAHEYARRKTLAVLPRLEFELARLEQSIKNTFGRRERDIPRRFTPLNQDNK